jgi:hypothetical protein
VHRRSPQQTRALGLWTAAWLLAFLLIGLLWLGDLALQWPVFLVPVLWALVAVRPRGRSWPPVPREAEEAGAGPTGSPA